MSNNHTNIKCFDYIAANRLAGIQAIKKPSGLDIINCCTFIYSIKMMLSLLEVHFTSLFRYQHCGRFSVGSQQTRDNARGRSLD
jgi:hypothetical protein